MVDDLVVCDTGPLIALALAEQLELLRRLYPRVLAPRAVLDEVSAGGAGRAGAEAILGAPWIEWAEGEVPDPLLRAELGPGEAAVIATAFHRRARLVLLDERRARRIAVHAYGLSVRGSAGVLVQAKVAGLVPAVGPLLQSMRVQGYYLSERLVERAAAEAGEAWPLTEETRI